MRKHGSVSLIGLRVIDLRLDGEPVLPLSPAGGEETARTEVGRP